MTTPPVAKTVPTVRTHHGDTVDRRVRVAGRQGRPGHDRLPHRRERVHRRPHGDQAGLRETIFNEIKARTKETDLSRAGPQGRVLVLHPHGRGQAVRRSTAAGPSPRTSGCRRPPRTVGPLAGEEVLLDGNVEAGDVGVLRAGHVRREPRRPPAGLLGRPGRRRAVHPAGQGPAHRRAAARRGGRTCSTAQPGPRDGSHAVLPDRGRGLAAAPGLAARRWAPRSATTPSCWTSRTSGSGSASSSAAPRRTS